MALSDDLGRAAGSGVPFTFGGEDLVFPPFTIEIVGEVKQHLLRQRKPAQEVLREHVAELQAMDAGRPKGSPPVFTPALLEGMVAESMKAGRQINVVTDQEFGEFIDTVDGLVITFWLSLERRYPGKFTKDQVRAIIEGMSAREKEDLEKVRDQAAGWDDLGNSTGRQPEEASRPQQEKSSDAGD